MGKTGPMSSSSRKPFPFTASPLDYLSFRVSSTATSIAFVLLRMQVSRYLALSTKTSSTAAYSSLTALNIRLSALLESFVLRHLGFFAYDCSVFFAQASLYQLGRWCWIIVVKQAIEARPACSQFLISLDPAVFRPAAWQRTPLFAYHACPPR